MTKKNIVWFSQHLPTQSQVKELNRLFNNVTLKIHPEPFADANEVIRIYNKLKGNEMVVVAPLSVINQLLQRGIKPLFAEMEKVKNDGEVIVKGRHYIFKKFTRIVDIEIKKEDVL